MKLFYINIINKICVYMFISFKLIWIKSNKIFLFTPALWSNIIANVHVEDNLKKQSPTHGPYTQ